MFTSYLFHGIILTDNSLNFYNFRNIIFLKSITSLFINTFNFLNAILFNILLTYWLQQGEYYNKTKKTLYKFNNSQKFHLRY